jgi:group I intron endonuclease
MQDGYMGSGKVIKDALAKHGIDNFRKDILETFANTEAMYAREKEVVTQEFLSRSDVYNLRRGGYGGFDCINSNKHLLTERNRKISECRDYKDKQYVKRLSYRIKEGKKLSNNNVCNYPNWSGRKHTESTRLKMSVARRGKYVGINNPQYNKMWITNGLSNKTICKEDAIPDGWKRGRTL